MLKRILPLLALFLILSSGTALSAVNPIIGSWGYTHLQHNGTGDVNYAWSSTKYGELTYLADGTGSDIFRYGDNDQIALTESFTYTTGLNPDGSVSVTHVYNGGIKKVRRFIVSDDGQMMVMDGIDDTTNQRFNVLVKMDKTKTYSNTDLAGEYYIAGYEKDPVFANFRTWSGISTYDGAGNYAFTGTVQENGNITAIQGPGTYFVDGDGQILYDEVPSINSPGGARLSGNNKLITENPGMYSSFFHMKKGDRAYSNADLAGTWALVGFGDDSGTSFNAELGTMTCDAAGNCNFNFLNQRDGSLSYDIGPSLINVAADGSFGASIGDLIPAYAFAIGNDGNAIMLNGQLRFHSPLAQGNIRGREMRPVR